MYASLLSLGHEHKLAVGKYLVCESLIIRGQRLKTEFSASHFANVYHRIIDSYLLVACPRLQSNLRSSTLHGTINRAPHCLPTQYHQWPPLHYHLLFHQSGPGQPNHLPHWPGGGGRRGRVPIQIKTIRARLLGPQVPQLQ